MEATSPDKVENHVRGVSSGRVVGVDIGEGHDYTGFIIVDSDPSGRYVDISRKTTWATTSTPGVPDGADEKYGTVIAVGQAALEGGLPSGRWEIVPVKVVATAGVGVIKRKSAYFKEDMMVILQALVKSPAFWSALGALVISLVVWLVPSVPKEVVSAFGLLVAAVAAVSAGQDVRDARQITTAQGGQGK